MGVDPSLGSLKQIALFTLLSVLWTAQRTESQPGCSSASCEAVADVYNGILESRVKPCDDFFTFVCSKWLQSVKKRESREPTQITTLGLIDEISTIILTKEIKHVQRQLRGEDSTAQKTKIRDSDTQTVAFFESCLRAQQSTSKERSVRTLRKFYREVGIPFFDEKPNPKKSAFSALMKLALQFDINPIFMVVISKGIFFLDPSGYIRKGVLNESTTDLALQWGSQLHTKSLDTRRDHEIIFKYAAFFDALNIHLNNGTMLRIGRNFYAVQHGIRNVFKQSDDFEYPKLSRWSADLNSTYFDLFQKHMGTVGVLKKDCFLSVVRPFFETLVVLTRNETLSTIFHDFLALFIARSDLGKSVIGTTHCTLLGKCDSKIDFDPTKYCTKLVRLQAIHPSPIDEIYNFHHHARFSGISMIRIPVSAGSGVLQMVGCSNGRPCHPFDLLRGGCTVFFCLVQVDIREGKSFTEPMAEELL